MAIPTPRYCGLRALVIGVLLPSLGIAQAWLPEKGSVAYGLSYNDITNKEHYLADGSEIDLGHTRIHSIALSLSYALSDRLLLTAGIPYVRGKYEGPRPHPTEADDTRYHATFTDARLELHWQATTVPFAFAPYAAFVYPTHDYETLGHAAPGRGLREYWAGFYAGKSLDRWLPRTYLQAHYNYAFVEQVVGIAHDRSNIDLEIGYFFNSRWSARVLGAWQHTHGGIDVPVPPSHPLFPYHDQLAAESYLHVGAGVAWAASERTSVYLLDMTSLQGRNGHKLNQGATLGFSYSIR